MEQVQVELAVIPKLPASEIILSLNKGMTPATHVCWRLFYLFMFLRLFRSGPRLLVLEAKDINVCVSSANA